MDPQMRLLLRLAQWLRHPPSRRTLWILGIALAVSLLLAGLERGFGWPDWLTVDRGPRVVR
ncbi:hypothetical protein [Rubritepida flocculans]|uniref:hypothetical protein n=1 Tax=Rubritepida flocculans TaxID=182403 RepID=UPI0003FF3C83|nr:hypothetical protein [Rubritepida flocculans]